MVRVHWSVWANPPWRPSFVIFFIIYCPYSPFDILNSYKTLMYWQIVSQSILKFKKCKVKNEILTMNFRMKHNLSLHMWFMRVKNITGNNRSRCQKRATKILKSTTFDQVLKDLFYLINDRWGLRGQTRWLAYWLVRAWWSIWANPPWCPSFVIFFIVYNPYSIFNILNSHKTLMQRQIVSQGILKFKKWQVRNYILIIN